MNLGGGRVGEMVYGEEDESREEDEDERVQFGKGKGEKKKSPNMKVQRREHWL